MNKWLSGCINICCTGTDVKIDKFVFQCSPGESNPVYVTALNTYEPQHVISNNVAF